MADEREPTKGYIVDLGTEDKARLTFQWNPEEIEDSRSAESKTISIVGKSHPRIVPVAGGERGIPLRLYFHRESSSKEKSWVKEQVSWLQSLTYPYERGSGVQEYPAVQFIFGSLYDLTMRVKSVKVRHIDQFDAETLLPLHAEVDVDLVEISSENVYIAEARDSVATHMHYDLQVS